jgi:hypothetical protein
MSIGALDNNDEARRRRLWLHMHLHGGYFLVCHIGVLTVYYLLGVVQACTSKKRPQVDKPTGYVRNPTSDFLSIFLKVRIDSQDPFPQSFFFWNKKNKCTSAQVFCHFADAGPSQRFRRAGSCPGPKLGTTLEPRLRENTLSGWSERY